MSTKERGFEGCEDDKLAEVQVGGPKGHLPRTRSSFA